MSEHKLIDRVVRDIQGRLDGLRPDEPIDTAYMTRVVEFVCSYADACHHGKEETILFRKLEDKPLTRELAETMAQLVREHAEVRDAATRLGSANDRYMSGDRGAFGEIEPALRVLVDVYPHHVETEERRFFKPAMEYFTPEERQQIADEFHEFDQKLFHDTHRKLVETIEASSAARTEAAPAAR